ncbi:MAG: RNA polymerase sigma factor [Burkholderiales bacterium]
MNRDFVGTERKASDETLMLAYRDGDAGAFDQLYARHRSGLYRFIRRQIGADSITDEVFQDVWMRAIDAAKTYEPRAKFVTWLYTIAHNRMMDHFRAAGRADLVSIDGDDDNVIELAANELQRPDTETGRKQLASRILAALDTLPAVQREAFLLQQEGELSVEEIAEATGVNRETAKSRLRYALAKLRRDLAGLA